MESLTTATPVTESTKLRGWAARPRDERRRKGGLGGFRAHRGGRAHEWTQEEARRAGLKSAANRAARRALASENRSPIGHGEFFSGDQDTAVSASPAA
jgi:hypothetical protein